MGGHSPEEMADRAVPALVPACPWGSVEPCRHEGGWGGAWPGAAFSSLAGFEENTAHWKLLIASPGDKGSYLAEIARRLLFLAKTHPE